MSARTILLASTNAHKLRELSDMLQPLGVEIASAATVEGLPEVEEDRDSFAGNAAKKALSAAEHTGLWSLADDSGLEVDALDGAPGIHSARFAGRHGDDEANNRLVLERLREVPEAGRGAQFVCALVLAVPGGPGGSGAPARVAGTFEGVVRGRILDGPRGEGGFGYDPLFQFDEPGQPLHGRVFAELAPHEKASVSHRGRALRKLALNLPELLT